MEDANRERDGGTGLDLPERETRSDGPGFRETCVMNRQEAERMNA
jgi:hypothetical protein